MFVLIVLGEKSKNLKIAVAQSYGGAMEKLIQGLRKGCLLVIIIVIYLDGYKNNSDQLNSVSYNDNSNIKLCWLSSLAEYNVNRCQYQGFRMHVIINLVDYYH